MEHNINIGGQVVISCPDLVQAATLFLEAFNKGIHAEVNPKVTKVEKNSSLEHFSGVGEVETSVVADTSTISDTSIVGVPETSHPGIAADGKPYGQFKEMTDLFDVLISMGCSIEVKTILSTHSKDDTYGGIAPKDWNATIMEAQRMIASKKKGTEKQKSENTVMKELTMEDVRASAREVQNKKGKEVLLQVFKSFDKLKLSEFSQGEYASLMGKLLEVL